MALLSLTGKQEGHLPRVKVGAGEGKTGEVSE